MPGITVLRARVCIFIFSVFIFSSNICLSQEVSKHDVIITLENIKVEVNIQEIDSLSIKYKKISDPDGPIFSIKKSKVLSVIRKDGTVEHFEANTENKEKTNSLIAPEKLADRPSALLKSDYLLYNRKTARYKNMGYTGAFFGVLLSTVGGVIMSKNERTYQLFNSDYVNPDYRVGALLLVAGLGSGIPLTIIGFTKSKRYSRRAMEVKNELKKRNATSFRISPGFNPENNSGYLSLRITF